jgi:hypothetical protein
MSPTGDPCASEAVRQAEADILAGHRDHLRELQIEVVEGGVIIRGRAVSFYGKQIAFHEVMRRIGSVVLANELEVQPLAQKDEG